MKQASIYQLLSPYPNVMTVPEVAEAVRCSTSFIYTLLCEGRLPCYHKGRTYRILKTDAESCFYVNSVFYPELGGDCYREFYGQ